MRKGERELIEMALRHSRKDCLARLRAEIDAGRGIVMTGAGNGLAAKFIERGGVDLIGIYNTGYFRMQGYGSLAGMLPILDANELVLRTAEREVLPQVRTTPVVAGVNGVDPLRDMPRFLAALAQIGISGVHNFPTVAWFDGNFRRSLEATGLECPVAPCGTSCCLNPIMPRARRILKSGLLRPDAVPNETHGGPRQVLEVRAKGKQLRCCGRSESQTVEERALG